MSYTTISTDFFHSALRHCFCADFFVIQHCSNGMFSYVLLSVFFAGWLVCWLVCLVIGWFCLVIGRCSSAWCTGLHLAASSFFSFFVCWLFVLQCNLHVIHYKSILILRKEIFIDFFFCFLFFYVCVYVFWTNSS